MLAHELLAGGRAGGAHQDVGVSRAAPLHRAGAALGQLRGASGGGGPRSRARAPSPRSDHRGVVGGGARLPCVRRLQPERAAQDGVLRCRCARPACRERRCRHRSRGTSSPTVVPDELTIATVPERGSSGGTCGPACTTGPRTSRRCSTQPRRSTTRLLSGLPGRAVAARLPEDAARAAEGRPEPRPYYLTRGSRSRSGGRLTASHQRPRGAR